MYNVQCTMMYKRSCPKMSKSSHFIMNFTLFVVELKNYLFFALISNTYKMETRSNSISKILFGPVQQIFS